MNKVVLNNGVEMPMIGLGVYEAGTLEDCERCVSEALDAGYRMVDTAAVYGNEEAVGRAVRGSSVPREEVFVITKLWFKDSGYERTIAAFFGSLKRLGLDYVDLYLIHQPYGDVYGSWRAMEELYRRGYVRAIGVSNFYADRLMDLSAHCEVTPAVDQIELHPLHQRPEELRVMRRLGVIPQAWGPLARGRDGILEHPVLVGLAEKHRRTVPQVILRWLVQQGITAVPKTVRPERMRENLDVFSFSLDGQDMELIASADTSRSSFGDHRDVALFEKLLAFDPAGLWS
jgi:2,5-diketo-D-gluconate reductase A